MQCTIFLLTLLSSGYTFAMDKPLKALTIINNHECSVVVCYEPRKEETRFVIPTGKWSCHLNREIYPKKSLTLFPLLTPLISIAINGFQPLQNLPIVKTDTPLIINPKRDNAITITQGTETLAVLKALIHTNVTAQSSKENKQESDKDFCSQQ